ncbi:MAG: SGNH/GDSL hydrolase family protein [Lachnospiraceae bacterium]|nr:SGNH/GDSL hydrolase family protein [Lachnospiraceae bacterium]
MKVITSTKISKIKPLYVVLGILFLTTGLFFMRPYQSQAKDLAPVLLSLSLQPGGDNYYQATLSWEARPRTKYLIYRKRCGGHYQYLDTILSNKTVGSYTDRHMPSCRDYTYTVCSLDDSLFGTGRSSYDASGLTSLRGEGAPSCRYTNLDATIRWKPVKGADGYRIYRKFEGGKYHLIGDVHGHTGIYRDIFHNTMKKSTRRAYLLNDYYMDPSNSCTKYRVRAYRWGSSLAKISLSSYAKDGAFALNTPAIIGLDTDKNDGSRLTFSRVPWADFYRVKRGYRSKNHSYHWEEVAYIRQGEEAYLNCHITPRPDRPYCTVIAYKKLSSNRELSSDFEKNFQINHRKFQDKSILFIGDSLTYGSPYKTQLSRYLYSYPRRIHELTGVNYYNAAIPGATLGYNPVQLASFHRYRIISDVLPPLRMGQTPQTHIKGLLDKNSTPLDGFDVVVLCAGTNDYTDQIPLGRPNDSKTTTYYGALNHFFTAIASANRIRAGAGKEPIQIVLPDLFYSDRTTRFDIRNNRFKKKNGIGLTLKDYQKAIDTIRKKYTKKGLAIHRFRTQHIITHVNCPVATADNLHMTKTTYARYGNELSAFLIKNVLTSDLPRQNRP